MVREEPNKFAVIGLGNTLRRDDGIGIKILESLLKASYRKEGVDYFDFGSASFDLISRLKNYNRVVLIDAIEAAGLKPGELKIFKLSQAELDFKKSLSSSHELGLKEIFQLCKNFKLKTEIYVAGIQVKEVSWKEGLSEPLEKNFKKIVRQINGFVSLW